MILRLDPRLPFVWRSPSSAQLGIDPVVVVLDDITELDERMLAALAVGVSDSGLAMLAGTNSAARDLLLAALGPALQTAPTSPIAGTVAVHGSEALVSAIATALAHSGVDVLTGPRAVDLAEHSPDLAILAAHFVLQPELHALWLRRDVPHLPVIVGDAGVMVGPVVEPGTGPCLRCLELHRRDQDAAWPAIATQLLDRRSLTETPLLVLEAAAATCRIVLDRLALGPSGAGTSVRIDAATGRRELRSWQRHPECGCSGIAHLMSAELSGASPAPPGTGWASAARSAPAAGRLTS